VPSVRSKRHGSTFAGRAKRCQGTPKLTMAGTAKVIAMIWAFAVTLSAGNAWRSGTAKLTAFGGEPGMASAANVPLGGV
jgi:hypothetical protein